MLRPSGGGDNPPEPGPEPEPAGTHTINESITQDGGFVIGPVTLVANEGVIDVSCNVYNPNATDGLEITDLSIYIDNELIQLSYSGIIGSTSTEAATGYITDNGTIMEATTFSVNNFDYNEVPMPVIDTNVISEPVTYNDYTFSNLTFTQTEGVPDIDVSITITNGIPVEEWTHVTELTIALTVTDPDPVTITFNTDTIVYSMDGVAVISTTTTDTSVMYATEYSIDSFTYTEEYPMEPDVSM